MVCLNESIMFNKKKLTKNIPAEINEMIRLEFDYFIEKKILEKIYKKINEKSKELFSNNHFLYINMDDSVCTHMYKRGRNEGYLCHKKIRTNLNGETKDYLCTKHSKKHIPKKNNKFSKVNKISKIHKHDNILINKEKIEDINLKNKENHINKNKNRIIKKKLRNNKKYRKIFICNGGTLNIGNILNKLL